MSRSRASTAPAPAATGAPTYRRCTGWTYYDANFNEAGRYSYRLQRLCVLGSGVKSKQSGSRPGRTSGVVRSARHNGGGGGDD